MDNTSFEPMDVDLSSNSITYMDVSFNEPHEEFTPVPVKEEPIFEPAPTNNCTLPTLTIPTQASATGVKVYHIIKKNDRKQTFNTTHIAVSILLVTCLSMVVYQIINVNCSSELDPDYLNEKLHQKVYGQYTAVTEIVSALKYESRTKLIFFYGGTGVGKTYTLSIMLEDKWNYTNIYHYTMPSFVTTFSTELMLGLTICNTAVFVVDDLVPSDLKQIKIHIIDVIRKNYDMNKYIVMILVFNCDNSDKDLMRKCDNTFYKEVERIFNDINAFKQFVKFEELSERHLKKCIEDELGEGLDDVHFNNIAKNFNVSQDGCKGVHKKIKILNNL
ncbi:uncharacterized protein LOC128670501 [Plodia interpunctella]|uniref:uncharacterized protein LOC128670501 n=1 Tax=Plodia interpunctella TaxID=58824 RepID=UPI002367499B|nr:uncharacterized protein LOC128670501 [Plodia interpunctella]